MQIEKIYDFVEDKIGRIEANLQNVDERSANANDKKAERVDAMQQAQALFKQFEDSARAEIQVLRDVGEFKTFTIAFYGETNAGKSTIIESLRLYFNEATKQEQRVKFEQNHQSYSKILENLHNDIKDNSSELTILEERQNLNANGGGL